MNIMALNTSNQEIVAMRRNRVASLRLKGFPQRQIWDILANGTDGVDRYGKPLGQFLNPNTGKPFSLGTINGDIKALDKEWRASASISTEAHQARQFSEIQSIKWMAFSKNDPKLALHAIQLEMKLLGTAAPERLDVVDHRMLAEVVAAIEKLGQTPGDVFGEIIRLAHNQRVTQDVDSE